MSWPWHVLILNFKNDLRGFDREFSVTHDQSWPQIKDKPAKKSSPSDDVKTLERCQVNDVWFVQ